MPALIVTDLTPILLDGALGSGSLEIHYGSESLADYDSKLIAEKDELVANPVRFEIHDVQDGSVTWEITASHLVRGELTTWARDVSGGHSWHTPGETDGCIPVDVVATNTSTSATETKRIFITVRPKTSRPDG